MKISSDANTVKGITQAWDQTCITENLKGKSYMLTEGNRPQFYIAHLMIFYTKSPIQCISKFYRRCPSKVGNLDTHVKYNEV